MGFNELRSVAHDYIGIALFFLYLGQQSRYGKSRPRGKAALLPSAQFRASGCEGFSDHNRNGHDNNFFNASLKTSVEMKCHSGPAFAGCRNPILNTPKQIPELVRYDMSRFLEMP